MDSLSNRRASSLLKQFQEIERSNEELHIIHEDAPTSAISSPTPSDIHQSYITLFKSSPSVSPESRTSPQADLNTTLYDQLLHIYNPHFSHISDSSRSSSPMSLYDGTTITEECTVSNTDMLLDTSNWSFMTVMKSSLSSMRRAIQFVTLGDNANEEVAPGVDDSTCEEWKSCNPQNMFENAPFHTKMADVAGLSPTNCRSTHSTPHHVPMSPTASRHISETETSNWREESNAQTPWAIRTNLKLEMMQHSPIAPSGAQHRGEQDTTHVNIQPLQMHSTPQRRAAADIFKHKTRGQLEEPKPVVLVRRPNHVVHPLHIPPTPLSPFRNPPPHCDTYAHSHTPVHASTPSSTHPSGTWSHVTPLSISDKPESHHPQDLAFQITDPDTYGDHTRTIARIISDSGLFDDTNDGYGGHIPTRGATSPRHHQYYHPLFQEALRSYHKTHRESQMDTPRGRCSAAPSMAHLQAPSQSHPILPAGGRFNSFHHTYSVASATKPNAAMEDVDDVEQQPMCGNADVADAGASQGCVNDMTRNRCNPVPQPLRYQPQRLCANTTAPSSPAVAAAPCQQEPPQNPQNHEIKSASTTTAMLTSIFNTVTIAKAVCALLQQALSLKMTYTKRSPHQHPTEAQHQSKVARLMSLIDTHQQTAILIVSLYSFLTSLLSAKGAQKNVEPTEKADSKASRPLPKSKVNDKLILFMLNNSDLSRIVATIASPRALNTLVESLHAASKDPQVVSKTFSKIGQLLALITPTPPLPPPPPHADELVSQDLEKGNVSSRHANPDESTFDADTHPGNTKPEELPCATWDATVDPSAFTLFPLAGDMHHQQRPDHHNSADDDDPISMSSLTLAALSSLSANSALKLSSLHKARRRMALFLKAILLRSGSRPQAGPLSSATFKALSVAKSKRRRIGTTIAYRLLATIFQSLSIGYSAIFFINRHTTFNKKLRVFSTAFSKFFYRLLSLSVLKTTVVVATRGACMAAIWFYLVQCARSLAFGTAAQTYGPINPAVHLLLSQAAFIRPVVEAFNNSVFGRSHDKIFGTSPKGHAHTADPNSLCMWPPKIACGRHSTPPKASKPRSHAATSQMQASHALDSCEASQAPNKLGLRSALCFLAGRRDCSCGDERSRRFPYICRPCYNALLHGVKLTISIGAGAFSIFSTLRRVVPAIKNSVTIAKPLTTTTVSLTADAVVNQKPSSVPSPWPNSPGALVQRFVADSDKAAGGYWDEVNSIDLPLDVLPRMPSFLLPNTVNAQTPSAWGCTCGNRHLICTCHTDSRSHHPLTVFTSRPLSYFASLLARSHDISPLLWTTPNDGISVPSFFGHPMSHAQTHSMLHHVLTGILRPLGKVGHIFCLATLKGLRFMWGVFKLGMIFVSFRRITHVLSPSLYNALANALERLDIRCSRWIQTTVHPAFRSMAASLAHAFHQGIESLNNLIATCSNAFLRLLSVGRPLLTFPSTMLVSLQHGCQGVSARISQIQLALGSSTDSIIAIYHRQLRPRLSSMCQTPLFQRMHKVYLAAYSDLAHYTVQILSYIPQAISLYMNTKNGLYSICQLSIKIPCQLFSLTTVLYNYVRTGQVSRSFYRITQWVWDGIRSTLCRGVAVLREQPITTRLFMIIQECYRSHLRHIKTLHALFPSLQLIMQWAPVWDGALLSDDCPQAEADPDYQTNILPSCPRPVLVHDDVSAALVGADHSQDSLVRDNHKTLSTETKRVIGEDQDHPQNAASDTHLVPDRMDDVEPEFPPTTTTNYSNTQNQLPTEIELLERAFVEASQPKLTTKEHHPAIHDDNKQTDLDPQTGVRTPLKSSPRRRRLTLLPNPNLQEARRRTIISQRSDPDAEAVPLSTYPELSRAQNAVVLPRLCDASSGQANALCTTPIRTRFSPVGRFVTHATHAIRPIPPNALNSSGSRPPKSGGVDHPSVSAKTRLSLHP